MAELGPLRRLGRRLAWPLVIVVAFAAVVFVGIIPTRTYLDKRDQIDTASAELAQLEADNAELQAQLDRLDDDAEIERLAREEYGLVKPGEEVYRVMPAPEDPIAVPDTWPFDQLRRRLGATPPIPDDPTATTSSTIAATAGLPPARD